MVVLRRASRTAWQGMHCHLLDQDLPGLEAGPADLLPGPCEKLPPWGFLGIDIDLDEPPVETLALNRSSALLTHAAGQQLKQFCLQSLHLMAGHVRKKHPGSLLAEQMEEVELGLRAVLKDGTFTAPPADSR